MVQVALVENVIHLEGELVFGNVVSILKQVQPWLLTFSKSGTKKICVDLAKVAHVDSAALALFCAWWRFAKENKLECEFLNVPTSLVNMSKLLGMQDILRF